MLVLFRQIKRMSDRKITHLMTEIRKDRWTRGQDMKVLFKCPDGIVRPVSRRVPLQAHPGRRKGQKCRVLIQGERNRTELQSVIQFM